MTDASIGHNNPPGMTETTETVARDLSAWMAEQPVIETDEQARAAKVWVDRSKLCLRDLEAEKRAKTAPLRAQINEIVMEYERPELLLEGVLDELESRLSTFLRAEEARRLEVANRAREAAAEAERLAREAERLEQERLADARAGELGVDVAAVTADADQAFAEYEKAQRQAAVAERDTKVKIGGGFSRAIGLRQKETLSVNDPIAAIQAIGLTDEITKAILTAARAYRRLKKVLPPGITATKERDL